MNVTRNIKVVLLSAMAVSLAGCPLFGPSLSLSTDSIHVPATQTTATFTVMNSGRGDDLVIALDTNEPWLSATFDGVPIPPGEETEVTVTIDRTFSDLAKSGSPAFASGAVSVQSSVGDASVVVSTAPNYFTETFNSGTFDLDGRQLSFTPDNSLSFYFDEIADGLLGFPMDPMDGALLPFDDPAFVAAFGDPIAVVPFGGATVPFYG